MAEHALKNSLPSTDTLAQGLGWFSLGMGLTQLMAPQALARTLGMQGQGSLIRFYGAREIASGLGILMSTNREPWLWSRVVGDGLDLATLARQMRKPEGKPQNLGIAAALVAGIAFLDLACARGLAQQGIHQQIVKRRRQFDYSDRSGFPKAATAMRGAAKDFEVPRDMRAPEAMRPYGQDTARQRTPSPQPA